MQGLVERSLDSIYKTAVMTVPVTCAGVTARAFWSETGQLYQDQQAQTVTTTDRHIRYRAWTLPGIVQGASISITFPRRTATELPRTVAYVVRTVFETNDGLEMIARVVTATP